VGTGKHASIMGRILGHACLSNYNCLLDLYAGDAELHCSHSDLQSDLDSVSTWFHSSHLCHKSNCMLIGSYQRMSGKILNVSIGGNPSTLFGIWVFLLTLGTYCFVMPLC